MFRFAVLHARIRRTLFALNLTASFALVALDTHVGTVSGLEVLEGKYVRENAASFDGTLFARDADTSVSITVCKDQIVSTVDDVKVVDW